jgi:hypothetical protein
MRLGLMPDSSQLLQMFPTYYIFNFLMTLLLILHVIWFSFLVGIVIQVKSLNQSMIIGFVGNWC